MTPAATAAPTSVPADLAAGNGINDIEEIEGIGPAFAKKLATIGIHTVSDVRAASRTAAARASIAERTGIKPEQVER